MTNDAVPPPGPPLVPPGPPPGQPSGHGTPPSYVGPTQPVTYGQPSAYDYEQAGSAPRQLPLSGPVTPPEGLEYHRIHRGGAPGWWRPLVGVFSLASGAIIFAPLLLVALFLIGYAVAGEPLQESLTALTDTDDVTPMGLAFLSLSLAAAIPIVWLLQRTLHRLRPGWASSVFPRIRWRWLTVCLGLAVIALIATVAVSAVLPSGGGVATSGSVNDFTTMTRDFLIVIVLLVPLQAAGEEYAFRGYLTQALGGLFPHPRISLAVAVTVPSLLFALAHGAQDAPIFIDRFAFGLSAGILVILTGGLEAGIAMHVLNNWLAFAYALLFSDIGSSLNPTGGTWWSLPSTLTQSLVFLGLCLWMARRMGVDKRTRTPSGEGVLAASGTRV